MFPAMALSQQLAQIKTKPPGGLLRALGLVYALAAFAGAFAVFVWKMELAETWNSMPCPSWPICVTPSA